MILAHKRRSPGIAWIYYCPVALLVFSFISLGDTLFGFNLSWYLTLFGLAVCLYLVDRIVLTWFALFAAAAAAVLGSFSSLKGLFIWPTALVLLALRRRSRSMMLAWVTMAIVTYDHLFLQLRPLEGC